MTQKRIAMVTGGNRGLGLETCRKLAELDCTVILTSRDSDKGKAKTEELQQEGLDIHFLRLDVTESNSIKSACQQIEKEWGRLDILINNAGILLDLQQEKAEDIYLLHRERLEKTLQTNVVGVYELCDRLTPMMVRQRYGRVVNVSSSLGQLSTMADGYETYRVSKAALNAVTLIFAAKCKRSNVLINSVSPGWVKTDMGGPSAPRSLEEGISGIIWAATLPDDGPTGGFFHDQKPVPW